MVLGSRWRTWLRVRVPVCALSAVMLSACANGPMEGDPQALRLADEYSTVHPFAEEGVSVFIDALENSPSNPVDVDYFPAGQLGGARDLVELAGSEAVDVTVAAPAYSSDKFPLSTVIDLPGITNSSCVLSDALDPMMSEGGLLFDEYQERGLRPLFMASIPGYEITTANRIVEHPEDVEGLVLRSTGGAIDRSMRELGAAGASMPASEMYEAISKGVVDGTVIGPVSMRPYKLDEVIHYSTRGANVGGITIPYVISESAWQRLGDEQQRTVEQAADTASSSLCAALDEQRQEAEEEMEDQGVVFTDVTEVASTEWADTLAVVQDGWLDEMDSRGLPGHEALDALTTNIGEGHDDAD